jgi:aromatic ring-opening dioxygenase catalytic subunit (LigB family)
MALTRLPTLFAAHGGGPLPVLGDASHAGLTRWLRQWPAAALPTTKPSALLVISAHWEEAQPTVTSSPHPSLIYDYSGFPPAAYQLKYPAPGSPRLAQRVAALLAAAGMPCKTDAARGLDHGTFIPLMLSFPEASIPVVQLSLMTSLDPEEHVRLGEALAPLRDDGVLIFASGLSFHNMGAFGAAMRKPPGAEVDARSKVRKNIR